MVRMVRVVMLIVAPNRGQTKRPAIRMVCGDDNGGLNCVFLFMQIFCKSYWL